MRLGSRRDSLKDVPGITTKLGLCMHSCMDLCKHWTEVSSAGCESEQSEYRCPIALSGQPPFACRATSAVGWGLEDMLPAKAGARVLLRCLD